MQNPKINFLKVLKWFFIFIFIAIHVQFFRGLIEILPALSDSFGEKIRTEVINKQIESRRSNSNVRGSNSSHKLSYYVTVEYQKNNKKYTNTDLVSEALYDELTIKDSVTFIHLKGLPNIGLIQSNVTFLQKNFLLLAAILVGVDLLVFIIIRWIKRRSRK